MVMERSKITVTPHVAEIVESSLNGLEQVLGRDVGFIEAASHTGRVVLHDRIIRPLHQISIDHLRSQHVLTGGEPIKNLPAGRNPLPAISSIRPVPSAECRRLV